MAKLRIGEILLAEGKIDEVQLKSALAHQRRWGKKIGSCLIDLGIISEIDIVQALSRALRLPLIDVTQVQSDKITKEILDTISLATGRKHRIIPLALKVIHRKMRLVVATSDPTNYAVFDDVQFKAGHPLLVMLAPDSDIDWFLRKYYMNEGEALPQNYVSGISLIQSRDDVDFDPDRMKTDPVSDIFFDEEFTGVSKVYYDPKSDTKKSKKD
ncbi:MAG: hypothetical protein COV44_03185 [Deltaproteobacteria bacterium CG11_big_fil_rev_8_21_14_0_20_45_16]|nr:MAG: hypothetical protein COV44_03185 [Deltaproteobacteria bacterium CG11_big_fil_rev_8_21_14_0_20_45_16]